jgi:hypothetical protein
MNNYPAKNNATSVNWRKLIAIIAQVASWFTTFWAVQWIWGDGPLVYQVTIAIVAECVLMICKTQLFNGSDPTLGWAGLAIDGIINTGGLLPKACKVLTFPPIAAFGAAFGGTAATCTTFAIPSVILALVFGLALSALPHRLWHD